MAGDPLPPNGPDCDCKRLCMSWSDHQNFAVLDQNGHSGRTLVPRRFYFLHLGAFLLGLEHRLLPNGSSINHALAILGPLAGLLVLFLWERAGLARA